MMRVVPYSRDYLEASWEWLNDDEVRRLTMTPLFEREDQEEWYRSLDERTDYRVWGIEVDGRPAGVLGLKNIEPPQAEYFGYLGIRELWGQGLGRHMLDEAVARARELGLSRLVLRVWTQNVRAKRLYAAYGFRLVGNDGDAELMEHEL
jgi:RimJ/RimL family protein N-acetyltransferase